MAKKIKKKKFMTQEEISEIERVFKKPISEIEELDIPTFIRRRDEEEARALSQLEEEYRQEQRSE